MDKKAMILDIAMNLNRVGNWAADDFEKKRKRIEMFLDQTSRYVDSLDSSLFKEPFKKTFNKFLQVYPKLEKDGKEGPKDILIWAEQMMTWGNILTHRSRLIRS